MTERVTSAFRSFAQAHLCTAPYRAVFTIRAGTRRWWTSASTARAAGVGGLDADQALRRFAAAGIVDQGAGTGGRRYRYRAEMDYLQDDVDLDDGLRDPVCGMPVPADTRTRLGSLVGPPSPWPTPAGLACADSRTVSAWCRPTLHPEPERSPKEGEVRGGLGRRRLRT